MKRIICMLFCLLMLTALPLGCQPTPDTEFVVNKGDNTVENKLAQSGNAEGEVFPAHWSAEREKIDEHLYLSIDAEVVGKAERRYPVYRTRTVEITDAEANEWTSALLGTPVSRCGTEWTKDDWKKFLQEYLDQIAYKQSWIDAGKPDWGDMDEYMPSPEEIEEETKNYMDRIAEAPDENESFAASDFGTIPVGGWVYTMTDGSTGFVYRNKNILMVGKDSRANPYIYYVYYYEDERDDEESNFAPLWKDVTLPREDAEQILNRELEKLGFRDFSIREASTANLMNTDAAGKPFNASQGWSFKLQRNPGNYPMVGVPYEPAQILKYGTTDDFVASPWIQDEQLELYVDENGVQAFMYSAKREIVGIENPNVELLPFSEVQMRVKNALIACTPRDIMSAYKDGKQWDVTLSVYRMILTPYTIPVRGSSDLYEMPCWIVFFDYAPDGETWWEQQRDNPNYQQECLILNAVDGSIVHTDFSCAYVPEG